MDEAASNAAAALRYAGWQRVKEIRAPNVTTDRLRELAADPVRPVRYAVARHPRTPPDALAVLLSDPDYNVRSAALQHRSVPGDALLSRFQDAVGWERDEIRHHRNAPPELRLGRHRRTSVAFRSSLGRLRTAWLRLRRWVPLLVPAAPAERVR